jgi:hypothetical protein
METIKRYANLIWAGIIIFLGALLFSQRRKTQEAESGLAKALTKETIRSSDALQNEASNAANTIESGYDDLKRRYDENKSDVP